MTQASRRALILGSLGAAVAAIARPLAALAGSDDGQAMLVGGTYKTFNGLKLTNPSTANATLTLEADAHATTTLLVTAADGHGMHVDANTDGNAIVATANTGTAVEASANADGTAVLASNYLGVALHADGRVAMPENSGIATVRSGRRSVRVSPDAGMVERSIVVATVNGGEAMAVRNVALDVANQAFTVHLTGTTRHAVKVAWLLLG